MDLVRLLEMYAPNLAKQRVKLVRNRDTGQDLQILLDLGFFDYYQATQAREVFQGADVIVSFIAEEDSRSRLVAVYQVQGLLGTTPPQPPGYPYVVPLGPVFYDLRRLTDFAELERRLVIDWGAGARSWVQWLRPRAVTEILPTGYVLAFPGYDAVLLAFAQLEQIVRNARANRAWSERLAAVAGVYLITDLESGDQYVGSASGAEGIWGRWRDYVNTRDGGNKRLTKLLASASDRHHQLQFSILRTLPRSLTPREVIEIEAIYKKKLGTRAFGLNEN